MDCCCCCADMSRREAGSETVPVHSMARSWCARSSNTPTAVHEKSKSHDAYRLGAYCLSLQVGPILLSVLSKSFEVMLVISQVCFTKVKIHCDRFPSDLSHFALPTNHTESKHHF